MGISDWKREQKGTANLIFKSNKHPKIKPHFGFVNRAVISRQDSRIWIPCSEIILLGLKINTYRGIGVQVSAPPPAEPDSSI